jgi:hypothetical protein
MGVGSWARFIVGLLLSVEIIREALFKEAVGQYALILSLVFVALTILFFAQKFIFRV